MNLTWYEKSRFPEESLSFFGKNSNITIETSADLSTNKIIIPPF